MEILTHEHRMLVIPQKPQEAVSQGGIHLGTSPKGAPTGIVEVSGEGCEWKPGDRIHYTAGTGIEVFVDGQCMISLHKDSVLAVER